MASTVYLRSTDGNDADDGSTWALAKATLAAALTAAGAGGTVYVSQAHAETQAGAMTLTSPGTDASPVRVICVNDAAAPPTTRATSATVTVSGNAAISFRGTAYSYGVQYLCASTSTTSAIQYGATGAACTWRFEESPLALTANAGAGVRVGLNAALGVSVEMHNSPIKFANVGARIRAIGSFRWTGSGSYVDPTGTVPTYLFEGPGTGDAALVWVEGADLSALGSGKALVGVASTDSGDFSFINCKLGSSVAVRSGTIGARGGPRIVGINCDSADTQYRYFQSVYEGDETSETTIVRSGGAATAGASVARKIVTTAGANIHWPYESLPIEFWNETLGSITITVPILTDGVTLTDAEAWIEVEYLGTSGFPLGLFVSDRVSDPIFGTPANQTTDSSSTWTTTGLSSPVKQSLSVTFTPQEKGLIRARVMVAKATTTVYYDPRVLSESGRQYQSVAGFVNEGPSGMPLSRVFGGL